MAPNHDWIVKVRQLLRRPDARPAPVRPVHAPLRRLLSARRHGVEWKVSLLVLAQASKVRRVKVTPRHNAGLYQKTGLAPQSGLWASPHSRTTATNQNERSVMTAETTFSSFAVIS